MTTIRTEEVKTHNKHIAQTYANLKPEKALHEVIYNALDASAIHIDIRIKKNNLGVISEISVTDNGIGIPKPNRDDDSDPFLHLGESQKKPGQKNNFNRMYHGKTGEGRYKAFSLGRLIVWDTKTATESTRIKINIDTPYAPEITDNPEDSSVTTATGTVCTIYVNGAKPYKFVSNLKADLERFFLTRIKDTNINMTLDGENLSVDAHVESESIKETLPEPNADTDVKTIVWKTTTADNNRIFYCDRDFNTLQEGRLEDDKVKSDYSIYIASERIEQACKDNTLDLMSMSPEFESIKTAAKGIGKAFRDIHKKQQASDIIDKLKELNVYPYNDEMKLTETEEEIKEVYDDIIIKLNEKKPAFFKNNKQKTKSILDTLKIIIEKDPENFQFIIEKLADLTPEESQEFADLLRKIPIQNIVKTVRTVTNRLLFMESLKQIAYGGLQGSMKERTELHKILEREAWIFGENNHLTFSDKSFNTIISDIRNGMTDWSGEDVVEGGQRIPDLFFTAKGHIGKVPHALIVELKRPNCKIGKKEIQQIKDYYDIVAARAEFANYHIDLIIVSSETDDNVGRELMQGSSDLLSYCHDNPNKHLFVRRWCDIIDNNEAALSELKKELELNPDGKDGMDYLADQHGDIVKP